MADEITDEFMTVTHRAAAIEFAEKYKDQLEPGWTFTVLHHDTGKVERFELNEAGEVVPCN